MMNDLIALKLPPAILALADGQIFEGFSVGKSGDCVGELVFNTAMTGYQEMISDPSYSGQIITLTTAHVGNTGCNDEDMESSAVRAHGVVMRNCTMQASNYRSRSSFPDWLKKHGLVAIAGIDTRALTLYLRKHGALGACISTDVKNPAHAVKKAQDFVGYSGVDLAAQASVESIVTWEAGRGEWGQTQNPIACPSSRGACDEGSPALALGGISESGAMQGHEVASYHLVVYDFGVKQTILRILYDKGCRITLVPALTSFDAVMAMKPDGIVLSNGPGDPEVCKEAIAATQLFIASGIPVLGICLGFQILGLACGARSLKMKFGHHGINHPVIELREPKRVFITSQNHGFAIEEASLPDDLEVSHRSLFDNSLQGFKHRDKPVLGFQGHPEAGPGPHDIEVIFDDFLKLLAVYCQPLNNPKKLRPVENSTIMAQKR